jgi:hypothetical protein
MKTVKVPKVDTNKLIDSAAKAIAYISLVAFASYGLRALLMGINKTIAYVFTTGVMLMLVYILSRK